MRIQVLGVALTVVNLVILVYLLARTGPVLIRESAGVVRVHELHLVDASGKVRAQLAVLPPSKDKEGKSYPETVLFRLIDPNGRPGVKIGTSPDGSGMSLAGDSERRDWNGVQILADAGGTSVKLTNKDGRKQVVAP
jgi:hypothetical protein